jgi:hypothetical protein
MSTTRRAYLFVVLGSALVALIVGLGMTIYQLLQVVLGVTERGELAADISLPLGVALVAAAGATYHGVLLRRDLAIRAPVSPEEVAPPSSLFAILTGPAGADLSSVLAEFRRHLPPGYDITTLNGNSATSTLLAEQPSRLTDQSAQAEASGVSPSRNAIGQRPTNGNWHDEPTSVT